LERSPEELDNFQGSLSPSLRFIHHDECSSKGGRRPAWMSKELLTKFKDKKEMNRRYRYEQCFPERNITQKEYRDAL